MILNGLKFQLKRMEAIIAFVVLMWFVICNYVHNVFLYQGFDVSNAIQPMKLLFVSYNRSYENADILMNFVMVFPFLCVMPSGFSGYSDYVTGNDDFVKARIGEEKYYLYKMVIAFMTTFIVFFVPILLEVVANYLSFPNGKGDLCLLPTYSEMYDELKENILFFGLYKKSNVAYALFMACRLSVFAGMLSVLTVAFSFVCKVRLRVFLFIPCYVFLQMGDILERLFQMGEAKKSWYHYLLFFDDVPKNELIFAIYYMVMIAVIVTLLFIQKKRNLIYVGKKK